MEICSSNHEEVVFQSSQFSGCPACSALEKVSELEEEVSNLQREKDDHVCETT